MPWLDAAPKQRMEPFWIYDESSLFSQLHSSEAGLSDEQALDILKERKPGLKIQSPLVRDLLLLLSQYKNPLVLLLVFALVLSAVLGEYTESAIVFIVLFLTGILGFFQERNAGRAVEKLQQMVHSRATVRRAGVEKEVPADAIVPGDIVLLRAGDIIPADAYLVASNDLHVNESTLTGESFPAEKYVGTCAEHGPLSKVTNALFRGSSVMSGTATALAVHCDKDTVLGKIGYSLQKQQPPTAFEKGISRFGYLLMYLTIVISIGILIINLSMHKPLFDSILFALALAVGLAPELLPAIVTITLAAGAKRMAAKKVIVKKLSSIQNLGEIDVLCCDKTGTLTQGIVKVQGFVDGAGRQQDRVLLYALLNATLQTGFYNPVDEAIRQAASVDTSAYRKLDEVPYDFHRKRLSIVVTEKDRHVMITKGAVDNILDVCTGIETGPGEVQSFREAPKSVLHDQFEVFSRNGLRTIAVCYKDVTDDPVINRDDEKDMTFLGFIILSDLPKDGIIESINRLGNTGIALKIITGDNCLVTAHLATQIGLNAEKIVTGAEINAMTDDALRRAVGLSDLFAEVIPEQKERIVKALRQTGHVVGYLGDGINDANALKAADVGISTDNAVDVAKEASDLVLLDEDIEVIRTGVEEGRRTFTNTMKYINIVTSSNFGNMISMAIASLLLPFLPLLPVQILLNNFLSDLPSIAIASDNVDADQVVRPRKWDIRYIRRFMIVFGLQSSLFDFATFGLLYFVFHATPGIFRTGWFLESLLSQILILQVLRTRFLFFKSRPSKYLLWASLFTFAACLAIPYLPFAGRLELYPLPAHIFLAVIGVIFVYMIFAEVTKKLLFKRI